MNLHNFEMFCSLTNYKSFDNYQASIDLSFLIFRCLVLRCLLIEHFLYFHNLSLKNRIDFLGQDDLNYLKKTYKSIGAFT